MATRAPASLVGRVGRAAAHLREASHRGRAEEILDVLVEHARLVTDATHAWAARSAGTAVVSLRSSPAEVPCAPLGEIITNARPWVRTTEYIAHALLGPSGEREGIVVVRLAPSRSGFPDDAIDAAIGTLAALAGGSLESARLRERIAAVTAARQSLFAGISHDLRSPLHTFVLSAGLLRDDFETDAIDRARGTHLVSRMDRAAARMRAMLDDLVEASRVEADAVAVAIRSESVAQLLRDAVQLTATASADKGPRVTLDDVDECLRVLADRERSLKMLGNAIAFSARTAGDSATIRLSAHAHEAAIVFTANLFGAGGGQLRPTNDGRGSLALFLARALADAQNGSLDVHRDEPPFIAITLPAAPTSSDP